MAEIEYLEVADRFKQCSVRPPEKGLKGLCGDPARYAVEIGKGWYWRCPEHKDVVEFHSDGSATTGHYSKFYPSFML
jgi:hypothetical protein